MGDDGRSGLAGRVRALLLGRTRHVMLVAGVATALLVGGAVVLGRGEVVILTITDDAGRSHETDVWIVELDGALYLRANAPDVFWLATMVHDPVVLLHRGDTERSYRPVAENREPIRVRVNRAMAEKYGFADRFWSMVADREQSVPIRLEPVAEDEQPADRRDLH